MRQNRAANRLGLSCVLAILRHPGRPLGDGEILSSSVLRFLASQIGADPRDISPYFDRPQTRREHLALLFDKMALRPFAAADLRLLAAWLTPAAQTLRQADILAGMILEELRRQRILLPTRAMLEAIVHLAVRRGLLIAHRALAGGLSEDHRRDLDQLLDPHPGTNVTTFAWARTPPLAPTVRNLGGIAARLRLLRAIALPADLTTRIPAKLNDDFAAEGMRMSAQHRAISTPSAGMPCWRRARCI